MTLFFVFDLQQYLSLENFQTQRTDIVNFYEGHPWQTILIFFAIYVVVTGLSLPGAALLTLIAGAIFGVLDGTIMVSFASTIGATLAFLVSRYLFKDFVQERFKSQLGPINRGVEKDGAFYLFALRLVPAFPFFVINLVMALTPIKTWRFYWISQIGMLVGTIVYVNAGTQIGQLESLGGILSPTLLLSFVLLGIFPFIAKKVLDYSKAHKVMRGYKKPKHFDTNLVVIGAGSAGLVSAYIAAAVKAKVTLIEKHKMGGDCLNTGCVPSKAILRSAKILSYIKRAKEYGFKNATVEFDFAEVMDRVHRVIKQVEPHDSVERYTKLGVDCIQGEAMITSPYSVRVNDQEITTRNIIIASGGRPFVPPLPGLEEVGYYTSDTIWTLRTLPKRLVVLGGGPIGCELAQAFARLGAKVTQVQRASHIMVREDADVIDVVQAQFAKEGIQLLRSHKALRIEQGRLICEHDGEKVVVPFDEILVAVGRSANTKGFGLEELGVALSPRGTIEVDEHLRTNIPTIYACGDVAGPYQFTHTAAHQAWYASVNGLFGTFKKFKADYSVIPWTTFTDPEVARVGLNEQEAKRQGIDYEVTKYGIDDLDRAIADQEAQGFVKVLTQPGKDKILGVTIVGHHAGDLITEYIQAMKWGIGLNKILGTIHIYPTLAEANKYAAGEWKRRHAPVKVLEWVQRFHAWRRN
ncbi:pyridine nucleotide-disulfide oxidoreductase [Candidatus Thiomargarita nelsonii]|uniref:Dihydrolipoyl dehydrogenase n=1 Tax=Candidatus Thiomargarita nelsonii TaxID=1003181 RepID=A0A0A6P7Q3_9GAMM|nr:pyridine nucleotide-disulfide oxidoreductase [Candidatus Thiomargarita nelsonii]